LEERERKAGEHQWRKERGKRDWTVLPVGDKEEGRRQDKVEERRKTVEFPQGLICKIRKLQGPVCKVKFPIDLKP
jgi:hypothetical protein